MSTKRDGFKSGNPAGSDKGVTYGTAGHDQIKGNRNANVIDGLAGDDVIIGYAGNDVLEGGVGSDDLSGGYDNDSLIGGSWNADADGDSNIEIGRWQQTAGGGTPGDATDDVWTFQREFTQDVDADDYVAAGSFADNGTDTIYGYDANADVIEVNALQAALNAIAAALDLSDDGLSNGTKTLADVTSAHLVDGGYVAFEDGQLKIDLDGGEGAQDVWFNVKVDNSGLADGTSTNLGDAQPSDPQWSDAGSVVVAINGISFVFTSEPVPTFA